MQLQTGPLSIIMYYYVLVIIDTINIINIIIIIIHIIINYRFRVTLVARQSVQHYFSTTRQPEGPHTPPSLGRLCNAVQEGSMQCSGSAACSAATHSAMQQCSMQHSMQCSGNAACRAAAYSAMQQCSMQHSRECRMECSTQCSAAWSAAAYSAMLQCSMVCSMECSAAVQQCSMQHSLHRLGSQAPKSDLPSPALPASTGTAMALQEDQMQAALEEQPQAAHPPQQCSERGQHTVQW